MMNVPQLDINNLKNNVSEESIMEFADVGTVNEFLNKYAKDYHTFDEEGFLLQLDYLDTFFCI